VKLPTSDFDRGLAKCSVAKSQSEPLVVSWPSVERARLEALARSGVVPVKYSGCEMRVLANCSVAGTPYRYVGTTRKHDEDHIRTADELYAKLPLGAAHLEGTLQRAGELSVAMTIVGRYQLDKSVKKTDLEGDCSEATHVISALTVGAFAFEAGASAHVGAEVSVFGAGAGGKSEAAHEVLSQDGLPTECEKAGADDQKAPAGCGALIRVELRVLPETIVQVMQDDTMRAEAQSRHDRERAGATKFRNVGIVLGAAGVAVSAVGVGFSFAASSARSSIDEGRLATGADIESAASRTNTFRGVAWTSFGIGVPLFLIGAGMVLFGPRATESAPDPGAGIAALIANPGALRW
jgi:hypothetical protein